MFLDELKRLHEAATEGKEGAGMDLRDFLEDHAAEIIALCEAAQNMLKHHGSAVRAVEQTGLREALAALESGNG